MHIKIYIFSIVFFILILFSSCNKQIEKDPHLFINKSIVDLNEKYGKYQFYYQLVSMNAQSETLMNLGYEIGKNKLIVYKLKNGKITGFHQSAFIHHTIDILTIENLNSQRIIDKYGQPFALFEHKHNGEKIEYIYYKWKKYWYWKKLRYVPGYTYQIIKIINNKVSDCYIYTFGSP